MVVVVEQKDETFEEYTE